MFPFERNMIQSFHLSLLKTHKNQGTDSVHCTGVQLITKAGRLHLGQRWDEFQVQKIQKILPIFWKSFIYLHIPHVTGLHVTPPTC